MKSISPALKLISLGVLSAILTVTAVSIYGLPGPLSRLSSKMQGQDQAQEVTGSLKAKIRAYCEKRKISLGNKATLLMFSDAQCPYCRRDEEEIERLENAGADSVHYVEFPLPEHPYAAYAARLSIVSERNKFFWSFHDRLYAANNLAPAALVALMQSLGMNPALAKSEARDEVTDSRLKLDSQLVSNLAVNETPTFVLIKGDGSAYLFHDILALKSLN